MEQGPGMIGSQLQDRLIILDGLVVQTLGFLKTPQLVMVLGADVFEVRAGLEFLFCRLQIAGLPLGGGFFQIHG